MLLYNSIDYSQDYETPKADLLIGNLEKIRLVHDIIYSYYPEINYMVELKQKIDERGC